MPNDYEKEILLKEHEELVSLYMHESKIKWNLISVYIALSVGLSSAVVLLIQEEIRRIGAVSFLCFMGFLFSYTGALLFQRHDNRISKFFDKGIEIERVLKEKQLTLEVFKICRSSLEKEKHPRILRGLWFLTIVWLLVTIGMILYGLDLMPPFFP